MDLIDFAVSRPARHSNWAEILPPVQNRRKIPFVGLCSGNRRPTFSGELHLWLCWCGQSGLLRSKPCLCVQLGLLGIFHSWFLEAGPGAKHLVTEAKASRGKAHSAIFSCQHLPISWSDCLNGVSVMFFHCCFWMKTFALLSTDFFWRLLQRWALWFIFVQISWICTRFFFCFLAFPPEGSWQQWEQAHAEGAFVARHWTHKWPGCRPSKASSSMKKPCWRQTAGTARPFPPNLWLVTFNGISSHAFELLSNAGVWPAFMVTCYWLQPTSIQALNDCLCLLGRCQAQSKTQLAEFPGMGSLRSSSGKDCILLLVQSWFWSGEELMSLHHS